MRFAASAIAIALSGVLAAAGPLCAKDPSLAPGRTVVGADGNPVGTVEEVLDDAVVLNTGRHRAPITRNSIEPVGERLTINATREQIDRMIEEQRLRDALRRNEYLAPGRLVRSVDGEPVGRIVAIEAAAESVVILRNEGIIALRPDHFAVIDDRLVALFSRTQIDESTKPVPDILRKRLAGISSP